MIRRALVSLVALLALGAGALSCHSAADSGSPPADTGGADPTWLREVGEAAGLAYRRAPTEYATLQGRMSGGVCLLDVDADGMLDLFFAGSTAAGGGGSHLYRATGKLTYVDEAAARGVADTGDSSGCVAFDVDGDGDPDLLTTGLGGVRLFRDDGGRFTDASKTLAPKAFAADDVTTSAAAFDADGDGDLDLAVAVYGRLRPPADPKKCSGPCASDILQYEYGSTRLLLQQADGTFTDGSSALGSYPEPGLVVLATDLDEDGKLDLFVGNDQSRFQDRYFRGDGKGGFTEVAADLGVAYNADHSGIFSMSAFDRDVDGDGHLDLAESSWDDERSTIFRCAGGAAPGACVDVGEALELFRTPRNFRWGQALVDLDDDGLPELFEAAGHYQTPSDSPDGSFAFPTSDACLLWHRATSSAPYTLQPKTGGLAVKTGGRGVATADLDGDGDLDLAVGSALGAPLLLQNVRAGRGHALEIRLAGAGKNTQGIGARVVVRAGARSWPAIVHAGSSFMSSDDARVHLGVGAATKVDVEVRWPSGKVSQLPGVPVDAPLIVREP